MHAQTVADLLLRYTQEEAESKKKRDVPGEEEANQVREPEVHENGSSSNKGLKSRKTKTSPRQQQRSSSNQPTKIDTLILLDRNLDLVRCTHARTHFCAFHSPTRLSWPAVR
jgi:hypothetical protein